MKSMKINKSYEEEVSIFKCKACGFKFWSQGLFGCHRFIINLIPKYCINCGSNQVVSISAAEYNGFIEVEGDV